MGKNKYMNNENLNENEETDEVAAEPVKEETPVKKEVVVVESPKSQAIRSGGARL